MARVKRINLPYSLYHVLSRTNSGDIVFKDSRDWSKFLSYLEKYTDLFSFRLHAFCLMPTHFHLILESTKTPSLSEFIRRLLTAYTVYFNRRHDRHGHLFQGRFKSYLVDRANYLLALSRYVHLNPKENRKNVDFEKYQGSSLRYYINGGEPVYLYTKEVLSYFEGDRAAYLKFIREGLNQETKPPIVKRAYVGNELFSQRIQKKLWYMQKKLSRAQKTKERQEKALYKHEEKTAQRIIDYLAQYFGLPSELIKKGKRFRGNLGKARTIAMFLLRKHLPWTCLKITRYLGLQGKKDITHYLTNAMNFKDLKVIEKNIKGKINDTHVGV
ncbi:transposase [Candidatus Sumerlaeota bacterium]|nr:transposase [Candidatus Sumerlaeota bacterium]